MIFGFSRILTLDAYKEKTYNNYMDNLLDELNCNFDLESIEIKKISESDGEDEEEL